MPVDYEGMTLAELEDEFRRLASVEQRTRDARKQIHAIIERRKALASARVRVGSLDAVEKEALRAALNEP